MNNYDVKLHDWVIKEQSNISEVELFIVDNKKNTMTIKLKKEALNYCKGATGVFLTKGNETAEETLEGPCVFSFFQETPGKMINTQIFSLYQYGEGNPIEDLIVIRKSEWERENDMAAIRNGKQLLHPTCDGISVVLEGNDASQILLDIQQISNLFYSGFSYTKTRNKEFGVYSLKVADSLDVTHEIHWDHKIQLHPIEEKIEILISTLDKQLYVQALNSARLRFIFTS